MEHEKADNGRLYCPQASAAASKAMRRWQHTTKAELVERVDYDAITDAVLFVGIQEQLDVNQLSEQTFITVAGLLNWLQQVYAHAKWMSDLSANPARNLLLAEEQAYLVTHSQLAQSAWSTKLAPEQQLEFELQYALNSMQYSMYHRHYEVVVELVIMLSSVRVNDADVCQQVDTVIGAGMVYLILQWRDNLEEPHKKWRIKPAETIAERPLKLDTTNGHTVYCMTRALLPQCVRANRHADLTGHQ